MKVQVICERCNSIVELVPQTVGEHAHFEDIEKKFRVDEIKINLDDDNEHTLDEIRIVCKQCGDYIVLNEFPSNYYYY
jgi:hypothetical protein